MAIVIVGDKVNDDDLNKAQEEYGDFVKIVVDVKTGVMAIGGEWHADAEKKLLEGGSQQDNLWGGSIDLQTNKIETIALINIRSRLDNDSQEILDKKIKNQFIKVIKQKFNL